MTSLRNLSDRQAQAIRDRAFGALIASVIVFFARPFLGGWVLMLFIGVLYHQDWSPRPLGYWPAVLIFWIGSFLLRMMVGSRK